MAPIRDSVSSPNQTGLEHPGLDSQYETSPWGSGSPIVSDGNSTWGKVLVDGDQTNTPSSTSSSSSSVWPLPPCSSSSSSSSSGCGTGSDPELASECMDADSASSSSGSEKNLSAATATVAMSLDPPSAVMAGAVVNGDAYDNNSSHHQQQKQQRQTSGGSALYSAAAAGSNNTAGSHGNKLGAWGAQAVGGSPCANGGLNPSTLNQTANHSAWPVPAQCQRHHQPPGLGPPQSPLLDWGGTAAPADVNMEDVSEAPSGTTHNTELNGPLNTMVTTTTNTNAGDNGTAAPGSWGSAGGGGASLTNGTPSPTPQPHLQGDGPAWGANTYPPGDKGDTVNPTTNTTTAAYKSTNTSNPGPPRWDQGLTSTTSPAPSNQPWGTAATAAPGSAGPTPGSGSGMGGPPTTGIPRPWGSSASSTSSSSSSSSSTTKVSSGEWGTLPPGSNNPPPSSSSSAAAAGGVVGRKGGGWKSLEDDALGVGAGAASQSPQNVPGGWARSGGSEGSAESSGGRSGSERDAQRGGSGSRRRSPPTHDPPLALLPRTDVDPRVLCNTGWGQTPVRQNTSWDVTPTAAPQPPPPPPRDPDHDRKPGNGGSGWGAAPAQGPSQGSGGWGERPGGQGPDSGGSSWGEQRQSSGWGDGKSNNWEDNGYNKSSSSNNHHSNSSSSNNNHHSNSSNTWTNNTNTTNKEDRPNTWTNAAPKPKPQQHGWGGAPDGEGWGRGGGGDCSRGASNHWNEPQKSAGPAGWESDADRSGSNWVDPNRAGGNNTWGGGGGSGTPDQNTHSGSTWGEPNAKPHNSHQTWGGGGGGGGGDAQSSKPGHGSQNWGEPSAKQPCNPSSGVGKPSGWMGGPAPPCSQKEESSSGWEEPSPESVRRRSEIDDGTAAWGDPGKYGGGGGGGGRGGAGPGGNGNMWNKSGQSEQDVKAMGPPPPPPQQQQQQQHHHQQSHQSQSHPQSMQHANHQSQSGMGRKDGPNGWRDQYVPPQQKESSTWSDPAAPPVSVDNGTSAWGKPMEPMSTWEDPSRESRDRERDPNPGWVGGSGPGGHGQHKPVSKPMESWGCEEMSMGGGGGGGGGHGGGGGGGSSSHWNQPEEEEEVEIGMWSNTPNQETTGGRSQESGTWNSYMKKAPPKMNNKPVGKQDDPWMNQYVKQFNNMNFLRDSPDDSMKSNKMEMSGGMMSDKRMDMNMGDYNGVTGKNMNARHQLHKEPLMDRSSYYDKLSLSPSEDLSSNHSMSFSPSNSAQPIHCQASVQAPAHSSPASNRQNVNMYGGSSAAQGRSAPQGQAPPLSSAQPNLRNPVPPPILPSQVPPSLLKYPGSNLFGPQQVAVLNQLTQLNQLSQLNQINQLQRLLLQQQQQQQQQKVLNQRPMAVGRHQDQNRPIGSSQSMMQPPRHLDPALLKQAAPSHQPIKSFMDNYMSHNAPELQKDPGSLGTFSNFPLGLNSNLNVGMDLGGGGGYKEPQSRFKKWTTMPGSSPLEQSAKAGAMLSGLRLEDSPFGPYDSPFGPSPISPPGQSMGSVGDGWPPRAKSPHGNTNVTWPPEFRPGEPWKGYPNIDPETDPFVTPGSVINNLSINTVRDVDHLRDRNNGPPSSLNTAMPSNSAWSSIRASGHNSSLTSTAQSTSARTGESKWSPGGGVSGSNSSLAHELWKVPLAPKALAPGGPSRPPPGLTGQKAPGAPASSSSSSSSSSWDSAPLIGGRGEWSSATDSLYSLGSGWDAGRTNWLVLKNLTPQIDGSTLRTLCMQHGPLITFQLYLPHGTAVVCYSSKDEAAKAKKSLHMCVLGNTTILAEFVSEEEITRFFAQGQSLAAASPGWQTIGSSQSRMGGAMEGSHSFPSRAPEPNQWNSSDLNSSSLWGGPNYSTSLWGSPGGNEGGRLSSPSPISSFLPVDHLTGGGDSM